MPYSFTQEEKRPGFVAAEIPYFNAHMGSQSALIGLQRIDADGKPAPSVQECQVKLVNDDGTPRMTMQEYLTIKNLMYRLLEEDGYLPPGSVA